MDFAYSIAYRWPRSCFLKFEIELWEITFSLYSESYFENRNTDLYPRYKVGCVMMSAEYQTFVEGEGQQNDLRLCTVLQLTQIK